MIKVSPFTSEINVIVVVLPSPFSPLLISGLEYHPRTISLSFCLVIHSLVIACNILIAPHCKANKTTKEGRTGQHQLPVIEEREEEQEQVKDEEEVKEIGWVGVISQSNNLQPSSGNLNLFTHASSSSSFPL